MNYDNDLGTIEGVQTLDTTVTAPLAGTSGVLLIVGTGALKLPTGTTGQQPGSPSQGMVRFNSSTVALETYNGSSWVTSSLNAELTGLSTLSANGIVTRTAAGTYTSRTITGTASNITVTNGDGVSGNPTIDLTTVTQGASGTSFLKFQLDTKGRVINNTPVVAGDITALVDTTYVNVSGDSMSSAANLTFSGGGEILGLPAVPSGPTAAASRAYVDSVAQGLDPKASVRVATIVAGTLASSFENGDTVDGVVLVTNDRILIKNQAAPAENGIYTVNASGSPTRAIDMDAWSEVPNAFVFVEVGSTLADTGWVCTSDAGGTLNTTAITWVQFAGAGSYTAGTGLTLSGTQFSLTSPVVVSLGGTGLTSTPTNGQIDIGNGTNFTRTTITQGTGITVTNGAGSITITNAGVTTLAGTANQITASASTGSVTLSLPSTLVAPGTLTVTTSLTVSGLTANAMIYSGTAGLITSVGAATNGQILIGSTGVAPVLSTITQGTGITVTNGTGSITITNAGVTAIAGTANQITASASTGSVTLSLPSAITAPGSLTVTTNLTVTGLTANTMIYSGTAGLITSAGAATNGQLLIGSTGVAPVKAALTAGTGISVTNGAGSITIANTGVTSVALALPSFITVSGSPVTTTGTLTGTLASQTANTFFAAPNGSAGAPTFRTIAIADLATAIQLYKENPSTPTAPVASGTNAVAIGSGATASATSAIAIGDGTDSKVFGGVVSGNGKFATAGDAQTGTYVLRAITTNNTVTELFLDGASATQRLTLSNNSLVTYSILVAGRRTDSTGGGAGYEFKGVIKKDTTAGSTTMVGVRSKNLLGETNGAWDADVTVDTTNGSLKIVVQGENAKTIRWVATVFACEVTN